MTLVDWSIVVFVALLLPLGWQRGLLVGVLSLVGFALGAFAGSRLGPELLAEGASSPYAPLTALAGGLVIGGLLAVVLEALGASLRARFVHRRAVSRVDAAGGAVVLGALGLAIAWVLGAVVLNAPGLSNYRDDVQRSTILAALNETLPPSGPLLNVLHEINRLPALEGPSADVAAPEKGVLAEPGFEAATASVVRVRGTACGLNITGSGWVAGPELVVTNAHVLAGTDDTVVETRDGSELDATAVGYHPRDDIAILRVPGLTLEPLSIADDPEVGTAGGVAGYPGVGDFVTVPARLGSTGEVTSQDSYGRGPIQREMTSFRAEIESGNSGGPVIDGRGRVLTTVFAATVDSKPPEGLGVPNAIAEEALAGVNGTVDTGPCA